LAEKLRLQVAHHALIFSAPKGYLELLGDVPEETKIDQTPSGEYDYAHLFVKDRNELDQFIGQVLQAIKYDAIFWISYPKGRSGLKTDFNRDKLWKAMVDKGIRPVT
jgi:hypothetical protein